MKITVSPRDLKLPREYRYPVTINYRNAGMVWDHHVANNKPIIVHDGRVLDGAIRVLAAKVLRLDAIEVEEVNDDHANRIGQCQLARTDASCAA